MTTAALNTSQDAKGFGVIQAEWYLNQNLPVNADFANTEFNYQEFIVAYQELLRGRETLAHDTRRIVDNTNVLVNGNFIGSNLDNADGVQPGTVYTITKETKTGDRIAHLINLVGITENKWNSAVNTTEKLFHSEKSQKTRLNTPAFTGQHPMLLKENTTSTSEKQAQMFIMTEGLANGWLLSMFLV